MILNTPRRQERRTAASEQVKAFFGNRDGASLTQNSPQEPITKQYTDLLTKDSYDDVKRRGL